MRVRIMTAALIAILIFAYVGIAKKGGIPDIHRGLMQEQEAK